jgi:Uma2 family endonuclease
MADMAAPAETAGRWPDHVSVEWTVDMLVDLPANGLRYEILDGTLLVSPSPSPRHQQAIAELYVVLRAACPADQRVYFAPLDWQPDGRTSLQPDLLVVAKNAVGRKNLQHQLTVAVEVLSPGTARIDRLLKFSRYAEGGVGQYWIVDPGVPSVQVYDLVDGAYVLLTEGRGEDAVQVERPLRVAVVPADLVRD